MATRLLDRVPVDRVQEEASEIHLGRVLLTLLVGVFWLVGWLAGKTVAAVAFAVAAVKVGYADARGEPERPARGRMAA